MRRVTSVVLSIGLMAGTVSAAQMPAKTADPDAA